MTETTDLTASGRTAREAFADFITPFEGRVAWMYLDTKALVTVGVGNLIDPERYALELPFVHKSTGEPATREQISAEWRRVKSDTSLATRGYRQAEKVTELRLTEQAMDELLQSKLASNESTLRGTFPDWDDWPADAQLGVHGMAWAMGPAFTKKFPKFTAAAQRQDWTTAAAECRIAGARERRNAEHAALFHSAAAVLAQGLDRSVLHYQDAPSAKPAASNGHAAPSSAPSPTGLVAVESPGGGRITDKRDPAPADLVTVEGYGGKKVQLHKLAAHCLGLLVEAARADGIAEPLLLPTSGYRSAAYQKTLFDKAVDRYGSPAAARKWVAPPGGSPHQSGRAIDFWMGIPNDSRNVAAQRETAVWAWLVDNAERFGFYPYDNEPWHWECNPPASA
jgi:LAS superfamily LD-carboxypeptidase LdcB/GH24 family phage-related lysozyme (muramidase)